ncbi:TE: Transposable element Tcb1 [Labeo rohita]|uniref:TE: Transposable element Tcb1 n=1 Tax=Labeo rohita TaxID=84645 RepID=A0A498NUJ3_LABRO|nr:TE: Transposable element Tcb1 [Labeo rohita]RXN35157.1 TE: Transposable element Tcb1 [Labeo rohita]
MEKQSEPAFDGHFLNWVDSCTLGNNRQDNDPKHTSRLCKAYLTKKESDGVLCQMTWPPQSPDLNPIEMVWDSKNHLARIWPKPIGSSGPDPCNGLGPASFGTTGQYRHGSVFPHLDQNWASSRPDADSFMVIWPKCGPDLIQYQARSGPVPSRIWSNTMSDLV